MDFGTAFALISGMIQNIQPNSPQSDSDQIRAEMAKEDAEAVEKKAKTVQQAGNVAGTIGTAMAAIPVVGWIGAAIGGAIKCGTTIASGVMRKNNATQVAEAGLTSVDTKGAVKTATAGMQGEAPQGGKVAGDTIKALFT